MSTYLGTQLLAGVATNTIANAHSLLDFKWTDHILNEMSWLRADTFSWHYGELYVAAYNHILADYNGVSSNPQTETVGSYTVTYYEAEDKHKIVLADQASTVQSIYNESGVAWYYILDTANTRFKLPRVNPAREELLQVVRAKGNGIAIGLTNGDYNYSTFSNGYTGYQSGYGASVGSTSRTGSVSSDKAQGITTDSTKSGIISDMKDSTSIYKGNKYLYFYVGEYDVSNVTQDALNGKANTSLDNLNVEGKNIANWSSNVTNCITEIPQDIKLELNSGTLTLKAGSKVYVPNGAGVFDEVTITNDISGTPSIGTVTALLFVSADRTSLQWRVVSNCGSGTTDTGTSGTTFYNTSANQIISHNIGGDVQVSLPIAVFNTSANVVTSINQVFNGFGYIGYTVFALPGVKVLIPNGRNDDGTLKNTEVVVSSVAVQNDFSAGQTVINEAIALDQYGFPMWQNWIGSFDYVPAVVQYSAYYNSKENKMYFAFYADSWTEVSICLVGFYSATLGQITNIRTRTTFHNLDYSDSATIAGFAMPSSRYIDLTLGASGTQYVAPANGYVILAGELSANTWLNIRDDDIMTNIYQTQQLTAAYSMGYMFAIKKGGKFSVNWGNGNWTGQAWQNFRFVYAKGEE